MRICFLITDYGRGGVERMVVNTASELSRRGVQVHLLVSNPDGPYLDDVTSGVEIRSLGEKPSGAAVRDALSDASPEIAISAKLTDDRLLAEAVDSLDSPPQILFRVGNPIGHRLSSRQLMPLARWWRLRSLRRLYRRADGFIAVSQGIAEDLARHLRVPSDRIHVLPNPTITDDLFRRAAEDVQHPWFAPGQPPVIVAAGGLRQQKDFSTLIRAFGRARTAFDCRLVILGEGRQRERLLNLAAELGLADSIDFPGWVPNPHAYMRRASVFAMSSRWEGSPNALVEAAALGTPVVATDCVSGPREILQNGLFGGLVPVGDVKSLSQALTTALRFPPRAESTQLAAAPYHAKASGEAYMRTLHNIREARLAANE